MFQATATTTTLHVTVACSGASPTAMTVTMVPAAVDLEGSGQHDVHITVDLAACGQHDVVLLPPLIQTDTMRCSASFTIVPQQQIFSPRYLLRIMPIMPWIHLR